jgi:hypothetical protein
MPWPSEPTKVVAPACRFSKLVPVVYTDSIHMWDKSRKKEVLNFRFSRPRAFPTTLDEPPIRSYLLDSALSWTDFGHASD